jgi:Xaa-Pro aminopeptidase
MTRLRQALGRTGPRAFLAAHPPNVRWLCGFSGSAGALLVTPREAVFLTDFRYRLQAAKEVGGARLVEYPGGAVEAIAREARRARVRRMGFEADHLTVAMHADLAAALPGIELVPLKGTVESLRAVKDAAEILAIRRALASAEKAFRSIAGRLVGRPERQVADELRSALRDAGADGEAFPSIIGSGPNGALPHATPTRRKIGSRDLVVIDFGALREGYACDLTRTVLSGKWDEKSRMIYKTVLAAQIAAIGAVRPGVRCSTVDAAARAVIEEAGYGDAFGHSTGHGVGLEVHERPTISSRSGDILAPGMVFTVEPGIYLPHFGGVRIEDMVLVTRSGCEVLSRRVPKTLDP